MAVSSVVSDYLVGAWQASDRRILVLPHAFLRLGISRFSIGIGPRFYLLFHFERVPRDRWPDYLLDEDLRPILRRINHEGIRNVVNSKELFHEHCLEHALPTVPILVRFQVDGAGVISVSDTQKLHEVLETNSDGPASCEYFCKRLSGSWGVGSFRFRRLGDRWQYKDRQVTFERLFELCKDAEGETMTEWIVQPLMRVHHELRGITSSGLSTVRAISVLNQNDVSILAAMLRITVGDNVIDNFAGGTTGNLVAPVDLETGCLGSCKGSLSREFPSVTVFEKHPDTGNPIEGFLLPHWRELVRLVERAHKSLPQLVTLAWDIAITDDGPVIIEANPTYDVSGMQVAHSRGLKPELFEQLRRVVPDLIQ